MFISDLFKNCSIHPSLHPLTVQKQNELALNWLDGKRMSLYQTKNLLWDKNTQKVRQNFLCIKYNALCLKGITEIESKKFFSSVHGI